MTCRNDFNQLNCNIIKIQLTPPHKVHLGIKFGKNAIMPSNELLRDIVLKNNIDGDKCYPVYHFYSQ